MVIGIVIGVLGIDKAATEVEAIKTAPSLLRTGMTEHVIPFSLVLIAQRFVGFVDFFELFFSGLFLVVASLEIRMVLTRQFTVGLLQIIVRGVAIDTEDVIVIAF